MEFKVKYVHTNLIAKDWEKLATFYEKVFGCVRILPKRNLSGKWIDDATSLSNVNIKGIHLRLPGYSDIGPTLEIFQYNKSIDKEKPEINQFGMAHIAFAVDDVERVVEDLIREGGSLLGKIVNTDIEGAGNITFAYTRDPEGNIIEIQKWNEKQHKKMEGVTHNAMSRAYNYCNNCGESGHQFHHCKKPITSIGIIAYRVNEEAEREYLMIRRKDTLGLSITSCQALV